MTLPKHLIDLWNKAMSTGKPVDIGGIVVCDVCDEDYTAKPDVGGFIFGSYAYCPACAVRMTPEISAYGEDHIRARCADDTSFADFVRKYRGDHNSIQVLRRGRK